MRKDSAFIFGFSLFITLGVVGGAYYMSVVPTAENADKGYLQEKARAIAPPTGNSSHSFSAQNQRTDQIIECNDPKVGKFFTNAKDCESADLNNRISHAQTLQSVNSISTNASETRKNLKATASQKPVPKPNLRQVARAVPDDLNVTCKFAVGRALEIERDLSAADNPAESIWREDYCKWIHEVRTENCQVSREFFYYGQLCVYSAGAVYSGS